MSQYAAYASTVASAAVVINTANTNRDGTGTIVDVLTAGTNGSRIDDIAIVAQGTTTQGVVRLYISDGTNTRLFKEIIVSAVTPSTAITTWNYTLYDQAIVLKSGWKLRASTHNGEAFNVLITRAGDF